MTDPKRLTDVRLLPLDGDAQGSRGSMVHGYPLRL